ncbi:MAG TPA: Hsp70 family protein [Pseudonocardiaceae bacterium]|nr:Hsp70 family protein [Pseudonocardiaceae bacterium]
MNVLSVDLGTANTVAVLQVDGQPPQLVASLPSAVFLDEAEGRLVVGQDALDRARTDPSRFEPQPKRRIDEGTVLLGDTFISVTNLLGAVLHQVVGDAVGLLDGLPPDELRLTHPDDWNAARCTVLVAAARLSGLTTEPVLIRESVAAAAHFTSSGQHLRPGEALAVYNLGAATFTCAVLGVTDSVNGTGTVVLAENGLTDVAGLAIDQALLEYVGRAVSHRDPGHWQRLLRPESVEDRIAQRELRESVRVAKEKLATQQMATVPMPEPFENVDVMRTELDALIRPNLLRGAELLDRTITAAGLVPGNLLGAYLVGGSSRMPLVAKATGEHLELRPISAAEPETAVAFGALEASPSTTATPEDFHPDPIPIGRTRPQFSPVAPPPSVSQPVSMPPSGSQPVSMPPSVSQPVSMPPSGSQPVSMPPSGSQPVSMPPSMSQPVANIPNYANYPPSGGFPNYQQQQPQPPAPQPNKKSKRVPIIIGVIVAVLVAGGVVGGIFLFGSKQTANSCQSSGSADSQGFTPCLRQLAGAVPQHAQCSSGTGGVDVGIGRSGSTVSCTMGSYRVIYQQGGPGSSAQSIIETLLPPQPHSLVKASWSGNSLSGQYEAGVVGQDGVLVFSVDNSDAIGVLTTHASSDLTPDQVADYFQANVQPGT